MPFIFGCNSENMTKPDTLKIKIIETSDVHGAIFPEDLINQVKREGSLAQVLTYVKAEKAKKDQEVIFVDNGDILQGDPTVYFYNFEQSDTTHLLASVMNYMGYDAGTVGNHDIEAGHDVYDKFSKELNFPWLAANANRLSDSTPYFKPYIITERQGVKIAILGLITPAIPNWLPENIWSGIYFDDMVESAKKWSEIIISKEKPDLLIGLFHSGINAAYGGANPSEKFNENAVKLVAEQVDGFDVIFAGHDHRPFNTEIVNPSGEKTLILDPGAYASNIAEAKLELVLDRESGKYSVHSFGTIVSMEELKPDSSFLYKFNVELQKVKNYVHAPVGRLMNKIDASEALFGPSAFVDLIHKVQLELSKADISFASPFSVNTEIDSGMLYVRDMFKLYRFENFMYVMKLSGKEIKNALEYSYNLWIQTMSDENSPMLNVERDDNNKIINGSKSRTILKNPFYNFDSGGGINYEVDLRKPFGERMIIKRLTNGKAFSLDSNYLVVMNSYRGNGGGNIFTIGAGISNVELKKRLVYSSEYDFRLLLKNWIIQQQKISAKKNNNWIFVPETWAEKGKTNYLLRKY